MKTCQQFHLRNDRLKSNQQRRTSVRRQETLTRHKKILDITKNATRTCRSRGGVGAGIENRPRETIPWNTQSGTNTHLTKKKQMMHPSSLQFHSLATKR